MFAAVSSATIQGVDALEVRVEAFTSGGLPTFTIVGLPGAAVQESRERVRANLKLLGYPLPPSRILVNLAPADVRKEGPALDLPIALALLASDQRVPLTALDGLVAFGELALDGSLRPARGGVAIASMASLKARSSGAPARVLAPMANAVEAALVPGVTVFAPADLAAAVAHLTGRAPLRPVAPDPASASPPAAPLHDLAGVRAQALARRALEVAAAGRHNLLLTGPPGAGKSMLARCLPGILPPLTDAEAIEVTRVHSSAGRLPNGLMRAPPFRQPHHSGSEAGIVGGGAVARPGEASLAHLGVLFLDELPEFSRSVLEALRQPLEEGVITISRASGSVRLPAAFQLVATRNPCPCGYHGADGGTDAGVEGGADSGVQPCTCHPAAVARYQHRVSGPLLDRMDLLIDVARLTDAELVSAPPGEASGAVAVRVASARGQAVARQGVANAQLAGRALATHTALSPAGQAVLAKLVRSLRPSARAYDRLLRVARTIADLAGEGTVLPEHLLEAAAYRG